MALESFYGGKQGVSPVIKAKFKYINTEDLAYQGRLGNTTKLTKEEARWLNDVFNTTEYVAGAELEWDENTLKPFTMDECLKNINYTDVWYGELCIIDTDNKMNPNNGKLYRRTLKQTDNKLVNTEDTLYAEYVGQIVGPSGGIPNFDFGSLDAERKKAVGTLPTYDSEIAPLDNSNWDYAYKNSFGNITSAIPNSFEDIVVSETGVPGTNNANIQMVPGKVDNKYNDTIRYTWCNVQRKTDGKNNDAWIYLGFEIPYTFYDVTGTEENYTYNGTIFVDDSSNEHPFYKNYSFHIPRGARGIGPEQLFVVGKDNHIKPDTLYDFDAIIYDQNTDIYSIDTTKIKNPTEKTYWVAKWRLYNPKTTTITNVYQYIDAYEDISKIELTSDGILNVYYSTAPEMAISLGQITWITGVSIDVNNKNVNNENYGNFTFKITFNNDKLADVLGENYSTIDHSYTIEKNLHLIKSVSYSDNTGEITFNYSDMDPITVGNIIYQKTLEVITDKNNQNYGKVIATKNTNEKVEIATLPLIKDNKFDPTTGIITFTYAGYPNDIELSTSTDNSISYISQMRITENGSIEYKFNTDDATEDSWHPITDGNSINPKNFQIRDIINTEIYNKAKSNDSEITTIKDNASPIDGHLYILFRGDNNQWTDLGQVKGNTIAGIVYTLDGTYESVPTALNNLSTRNFDDTAANSIGGDNDGRIKVEGTDVSGGLVVASIGNAEPYSSAIFYYNQLTNRWVSAGIIGDSGSSGSLSGNSNIYIQSENSTIPSDANNLYPKIYFMETPKSNDNANYSSNDFSPWLGSGS